MSVDTVCRVCLVNNLNLYGVRSELQNAYERITREKFYKVGYPVSMCYICLSVLRKCDRFMETARASNRLLEQWHNQQTEMRVAKPLVTYSITKVELVSTENEDISSEHHIKTENIDLAEQLVVDSQRCSQTEYTEYKTDTNIEKKDADEQTDYSTNRPYNETTVVNDDQQTDSLFENDVKIEWSSLDITSQHNNDYSQICQITEVKSEIETYDEIQLSSGIMIPIEFNTGINIQEPHKSDTDNIVADDVCHTENISKNTETGISKHKNKQNEKGLHTCYICKKCCRSSSGLRQHFIIKHPSAKFDTEKKKDEIYSCNECTYKSLKKHLVMRHMKTHTGGKPFYCDICDYNCLLKQQLTAHIRTHTGEKPFSCHICSYKSAQKANLTEHMTIHFGVKPFSCEFCNYKCGRKANLTKHVRVHTGEKPFSCEFCSYKCAGKSNLTRHIKTHTGEKPYSCHICGYKFIEKSDLNRHMRIHTGKKHFSCDLCSFKFLQKSALTRHMTTHFGAKPFSCDTCGYTFTRKSNLVKHFRTHTGQKPLSCDI